MPGRRKTCLFNTLISIIPFTYITSHHQLCHAFLLYVWIGSSHCSSSHPRVCYLFFWKHTLIVAIMLSKPVFLTSLMPNIFHGYNQPPLNPYCQHNRASKKTLASFKCTFSHFGPCCETCCVMVPQRVPTRGGWWECWGQVVWTECLCNHNSNWGGKVISTVHIRETKHLRDEIFPVASAQTLCISSIRA